MPDEIMLLKFRAFSLYAELTARPVHAAGDVLEGDKVYQRGTREGWATGGDN